MTETAMKSRAAAIWSSVAQRPLSTRQIRMLARIHTIENVERVVDKAATASTESKRVRTSEKQRTAHPFTAAEAHAIAAATCIIICSKTTIPHPAHDQGDDDDVSAVAFYAWENWRKHLSLSGCSLDNKIIGDSANLMLSELGEKLLVFSVDLADLLTGPFKISKTHGRAEAEAQLRHVQAELQGLIPLLAQLLQQETYGITLEAARQIFQASILSTTWTKERESNSAAPSTLLEDLMAKSLPLFAQQERRLIQCLAEISQRLRSFSRLVDKDPLQKIFLKDCLTESSPPHILTHAADSFGALASYPYWGVFPDIIPANTVNQRQRVSSISRFRRNVASVVYTIQTPWIWSLAPTSLTINVPSTGQMPSSFTELPLQLQGGTSPLWYLDTTCIPFSKKCSRPNPFSTWPSLKTVLLTSGYRAALTYFTAAILLNQLRYMFTPWLGAYIWSEPLEDLRLARSNPDVFLSELLSTPWTLLLLLSPIQRYLTYRLFDTLAKIAFSPTKTSTNHSPTIHLYYTLLLTHLLTTLEYTPTLLLHTTASLLSVLSLLTGPPSHQQALRQLLINTLRASPVAGALKVLYITLLLSRNIFLGIFPLIQNALRRSMQWHPGLLFSLFSTVGFTMMLLRYRSTFFIALQVHRMFVALVFFIGAVVILCREFVSDPIGLRQSTRRLREVTELAKETAPILKGAKGRTRIQQGEARAPGREE